MPDKNRTLDIHEDAPQLLTLFRRLFPSLHESVRQGCEAYKGSRLTEDEWEQLAASIHMHYNCLDLKKLDEEARDVFLPKCHANGGNLVTTRDKPEWMSKEFDLFGFFIATEF